MATNSMHFEGMQELAAYFETMPDHLSDKASDIVNRTADEAADDVRAEYERLQKPPAETGNLVKGVKVKRKQTVGHVAVATVVSSAPHSHLFEEGSEMRETKTGAARGQMPAQPVVKKIAPRKRREMDADLIEMIEKETGAVIVRG